MVTTIGLVGKQVIVKHTQGECETCKGKGQIVVGVLPSNRVKGIKESGNIELFDDCTDCSGTKTETIVVKKITRAERAKAKPIII
jgi:hypothetical protein